METLASNLNFAMDIQPPPNGELWGENKDGSFTGELRRSLSTNTDNEILSI